MKSKYQMLALFILLVTFVGLLGGWFTHTSVRDWYPTLIKPSWTPPNWVFGPVWTILYLLMAFAIWLVWQERPQTDAYFWFGIQLTLNLLWSFLFFFLQSPLTALVGICFLWWSIVMTMIVFWKYSRLATLLLIPYIIWVTFAVALNLGIVTMQSFLRTVNHF